MSVTAAAFSMFSFFAKFEGVNVVLASASGDGAWLKNIILNFLTPIVEMVFRIIDFFTTGFISTVLYFPPPGEFALQGEPPLNPLAVGSGGLNSLSELYIEQMVPIFFSVLSVTAILFFLISQLFPGSSNTDYNRFIQRVFIAVVLLIVGFKGFDLVVQMTNQMGQYMYPDEYMIAFTGDQARQMSTLGLSGAAVIVLPFLIGPTLIITYVMFLTMLVMRWLVVYAVYAIFPLLVALWVVDAGPAKYLKMFSGLAFKAVAFMLILGLFISATLGVSGAIMTDGESVETASLEDTPTVEKVLDEQFISQTSTRDEMATGVYSESGGQLATQGTENKLPTWFKFFAWVGGLWLGISVAGMFLGVTLSTGYGSNMAKTRQTMYYADEFDIPQKVRSTTPGAGGDGSLGNVADNLKDDFSNVADRVSGGRYSSYRDSAKDTVGGAKETVGDYKERASQVSEQAKEIPKKAPEPVQKAGSGVKWGAKGVSSAVETPANLTKRGAKAYYDVAKQRKGAESIGKAWGIAQRSKIGTKQEKKLDEEVSVDNLAEAIEESDNFAGGDGDISDEEKYDEDPGQVEVDADKIDFDTKFDVREFTFEAEETRMGSDGLEPYNDGDDMMQKGKFVGPEGREIPSVSFQVEKTGHKLEDGETYSAEDLQLRKWHDNRSHSHQEKPLHEDGHYAQIHLTPESSVSKVSDGGQGDSGSGERATGEGG